MRSSGGTRGEQRLLLPTPQYLGEIKQHCLGFGRVEQGVQLILALGWQDGITAKCTIKNANRPCLKLSLEVEKHLRPIGLVFCCIKVKLVWLRFRLLHTRGSNTGC